MIAKIVLCNLSSQQIYFNSIAENRLNKLISFSISVHKTYALFIRLRREAMTKPPTATKPNNAEGSGTVL